MDRDDNSTRPEKEWKWADGMWDVFGKVWFPCSSTKMISLVYAKLVMSHEPSFYILNSRKQVPHPLCPCGKIEDLYHICFECPLLPPPDPSYLSTFISNTPAKLAPIAKELGEKVLKLSHE